MSKRLSKLRHPARRLPGHSKRVIPSVSPPPVNEVTLPCSDLLRIVSELHLNRLMTNTAPPRLAIAGIPKGLGMKQKLPRHAGETRAIEGYHQPGEKGTCSMSVSVNSLGVGTSLTPSPVPTVGKKLKTNEIRRSYQSSRSPQPISFITQTRVSPNARSVSVRSTTGFSPTPPPHKLPSASPSLLSYVGDYTHGLRHGDGEAIYSNGDTYKGNWAEGYRYGYGEYRYIALGITYIGDWVDDLKTGKGLLRYENGDTMECIWKDDYISDKTALMTYIRTVSQYNASKHGNGTLTYQDGWQYTGHWWNDRRHGVGLLTSSDSLYEGSFVHDSACGSGLLYMKNALFLRAGVNSSSPFAAIPIEKERLLGDLSDYFHFTYTTIICAGDIVYKSIPVEDLLTHITPPNDYPLTDGSYHNGVLSGAAIVLYGAFGHYKGTLIEGKRSGFGQMVYTNKGFSCLNLPEAEGTYIGRWRNDERHGQGCMRWTNGLVYTGEFIRDRIHNVIGTIDFSTGERYEGHWVNGLMHGNGSYCTGKGTVYIGEFISGHPVRIGELRMKDGSVYRGEIVDMRPCGKGTCIDSKGNKYEGEWIHGEKHGKGKMEYMDGSSYEGEWKGGKRQGKGIYTSHGETYTGLWDSDLQHGAGQLRTAENETFAGTWRHGQAEGRMEVVGRREEDF